MKMRLMDEFAMYDVLFQKLTGSDGETLPAHRREVEGYWISAMANPQWNENNKPDDWQSHVHPAVREFWDDLPSLAQLCVAIHAQEAALKT